MKPLNNYIYIDQEEKKTEHGLITALQNPEGNKAERATVLACGPDVTGVKKGDRIIFKSYNLFIIELDGVDHAFVTEDEVLAKV